MSLEIRSLTSAPGMRTQAQTKGYMDPARCAGVLPGEVKELPSILGNEIGRS